MRTGRILALVGGVSAVLALSGSVYRGQEGPQGQTGMAPAGVNYNQVAILKWYAANQTTSFGAGSQPVGVAFDGANIWVANGASNTISKL